MTPMLMPVCRAGAALFLFLFLILGLSACGGGAGSGGTRQDPDPVVVDLPVAYVKRVLPVDTEGNPVYPDLLNPRAFNPGAALYIKDRAAASAAEVDITRDVFVGSAHFTPDAPNYDVKDVSTSADGTRLLFSLRAPADPDAEDAEQPTWDIYEYQLDSRTLRRVIRSDITAGRGDDVAPVYLVDGSILFASNRQTRSREILLDEGRPAYQAVTERDEGVSTFVLHKMQADGSGIQQLSFNLSHDFQPVLLQNGRVLFTRWDSAPNRISLYSANPNGTDVQLYAGYRSLNPTPDDANPILARLFRPQELPDGRIAAIAMPNESNWGGAMVVVDARTAAEPTPESITTHPIPLADDRVSLHGRFAALSPLYDGTQRLLVSWSQCRLQETATGRLRPCTTGLLVDGEPVAGYEEAPPFYGLWIYDLANNTQLPVVLAQEGYLVSEAVALEHANRQANIAPSVDASLAAEGVGLLHIRSVYDLDGQFNRLGARQDLSFATLSAAPADQRPARFLRLVKPIPVPSNDTLDEQDDNAYGNLMGGQANGAREILGYVPIEPDGSVQVRLPADVPFAFEVLDRQGRRIQARHPVWLSLRPGEVRQCHGCHAANNTEVVHGRMDGLQPAPLNQGAETAASFAHTQRYDRLGTPLVPQPGQTMAQFAAHSTYCAQAGDAASCYPLQGPLPDQNYAQPSVDIRYREEWRVVPSSPSDAFTYAYNDLVPGAEPETIAAPVNEGCRSAWHIGCRTVINYEYHIQPLWERERGELTITDTGNTYTGSTCLACHASTDTNNAVRVPAGQLQLGRTKAAANQPMLSYTQLVQARNRQILLAGDILTTAIPVCELEVDMDDIPECLVPPLVDGVRRCADVDNCDFEQTDERDGEGNLIGRLLVLDELGQPIPRTAVQPLAALVSRAGANNSADFFNLFRTPGASHDQLLNDAELKLIAEWLDLNGRYYNNPFELAVPQ